MIAKAFDMGWGGVVFKTVSFLNINEVSPRFDQVGKEGMPFIGFRNMEQTSANSLEEDFAVMARLKKDYPTKVIVAPNITHIEEPSFAAKSTRTTYAFAS